MLKYNVRYCKNKKKSINYNNQIIDIDDYNYSPQHLDFPKFHLGFEIYFICQT